MPDFTITLEGIRITSSPRRSLRDRPDSRQVDPVFGQPARNTNAAALSSLLDNVVSYDPIDGVLMRTSGPNRGRAVCPGRDGRSTIAKSSRSCLDVAWLLYTGKIPTGRVYPLNGDRTDLRICNLRMEVPA